MNSKPVLLQNRLTPFYKLLKNNLDINYRGLENIKPGHNYIFAMNHQSIMDIPIAFSLLTPVLDHKLILFLSHKFYDFFWPVTLPLEVIRIELYSQTEKSKKYNNHQLSRGIFKIKAGNSALIYPEGIIRGGLNNELIRGKTGVIRLALLSKVPIIPIGISGSNSAYPFLLKTKNPFVFHKDKKIKIKIGKRINLDRYFSVNITVQNDKNKKLLRALTDDLITTLSELSGLPYRPEKI
jgi:1-acyl-sn-glycerol-3-phosphate acyltransferase